MSFNTRLGIFLHFDWKYPNTNNKVMNGIIVFEFEYQVIHKDIIEAFGRNRIFI